MKKQLLAICALILALAICFTACGAPAADAPAADAPAADAPAADAPAADAPAADAPELSADPVTITLWTSPDWAGVWGGEEDGNYGDFFRYAAEEFMKVNENVTVNIEVVPAEERSEKLSVAISSNTLPDIYVEGDFTMYDYAHAGLLYPVTSIVTEEDKTDIAPALWDMVTTDGEIYLFPFFTETGHLAINLSLCRQYGVDPKDYISQYGADDEVGRWTPDEFKAFLTALRDALPEGVYPYNFFCGTAAGDTFTRLFLTMYGGTNFDPETKMCVSNSEDTVRALQFLVDCNNEGLFAPGAESMTVLEAYELFHSQQVAVSICNNVNYDQWHEDQAFDLKMMYLPNEGDPTCYSYDKGSVVFNSGDEARIAAALAFIDFYSHDPYSDASLAMLPLRASVAAKVDDPVKSNLILSNEFAGDFWMQVPGYSACRAYFYPEVQAAITGAKTAQQAMDDSVANTNAIIEEEAEMSVFHQ